MICMARIFGAPDTVLMAFPVEGWDGSAAVVVRQSGGTVRIRSRLREGTTVQIYLPRTIKPRALGSHSAIDAEVAEMAHILVVDDDPDVRWITAEDLREIGYVVAEADGGRAALAILERDDPCDLMLVDLVMTGLTGVDTVRLVRRARPDLKVPFFSGYADMSRLEKDIGDEVLLKKPFRQDTLAEAVRAALLHRSAVGGEEWTV